MDRVVCGRVFQAELALLEGEKCSGSSCVSCTGKVGQSPGQGTLPHPHQRLRWSCCVLVRVFFFLGGEEVFFYVPGKQHLPKLKMSFPINGEVWVLPAVEVVVMQVPL